MNLLLTYTSFHYVYIIVEMMCQVWSKKKTTTKQNPKKAAFFFALLLQILELMHNRIPLYHMAKTGEKACVLEINFTNEKKKKKGKMELRMLIK